MRYVRACETMGPLLPLSGVFALQRILYKRASRALCGLFAPVCFAVVFILMTRVAVAQNADEPSGMYIPIRLPIVGTVDTQVQATILRQFDRLKGRDGRRGILVLGFDSSGENAGGGSDFGRSFELAKFLCDQRMSGIKTVAFISESLTGHGVLVALACEQIVMAPEATFGPANTNTNAIGPHVDDAMRAAYKQIANYRKTVPESLALAMIDPKIDVLRVSTDQGEEFIRSDQLEETKRKRVVLGIEEIRPTPVSLSGRRARQFGIVKSLARSLPEVAESLGMPARLLDTDPSLFGDWKPLQVFLKGPIEAQNISIATSHIEKGLRDSANMVILRIDSPGGSTEQSLVFAAWLASFDASRVRTIAYVPREARGDAALIAMACDEMVVHPDAVLGGDGAAFVDERQGDAITAAWREGVAAKRSRSWSLPVAMVRPGLVVKRATKADSGFIDYFSTEELESRADQNAWTMGAEVGTGPIVLSGRRATELAIASHEVEDFEGLKRAYGIGNEVIISEPGWVDVLLNALAAPGVAWLLLLIAGAGLYIEMHTPGIGIGGFVSLVAFVIYFWSQYLNGTSGWLEVMLFLVGLFCLATELFVLPGFGIFGFGGGLLIVVSLVLASQTFVLPSNDYQIRQMQYSLVGLLGAVIGIGLLSVLFRRWLPSMPVLHRILLKSPHDGVDLLVDDHFDELIGLEGVATTRLSPAGKARIAGRLVDVMSDSGLLEPGTAVRVVEIRARRVLVRLMHQEE